MVVAHFADFTGCVGLIYPKYHFGSDERFVVNEHGHSNYDPEHRESGTTANAAKTEWP